MSVSRLVAGVVGLPEETKRKISSIIGAVVADAASLPLEWIYQEEKMNEIVGDSNPEFWRESKCPFFTVPTGKISCYTDELISTLETLAISDGNLDISLITSAIQTKFGAPGSPYQVALAKRSDKKYPIPGPWINSAVIKSLSNIQEGVIPSGSDSCEDNDGYAVSLPSYLLKFSPEQSGNTASILTTNQVALSHLDVQTAIIKNFITGIKEPVNQVIKQFETKHPEIVSEIEYVLNLTSEGKSVKCIVETCGKACGLPGSFQGALASIVAAPDYVWAVRKNILAGGDCNARANFMGACLGAKFGIEGIPIEWIEKVDGINTILENAVKVFAASN